MAEFGRKAVKTGRCHVPASATEVNAPIGTQFLDRLVLGGAIICSWLLERLLPFRKLQTLADGFEVDVFYFTIAAIALVSAPVIGVLVWIASCKSRPHAAFLSSILVAAAGCALTFIVFALSLSLILNTFGSTDLYLAIVSSGIVAVAATLGL
jgi:hypothetical protein